MPPATVRLIFQMAIRVPMMSGNIMKSIASIANPPVQAQKVRRPFASVAR
jgi:hypothetical protein